MGKYIYIIFALWSLPTFAQTDTTDFIGAVYPTGIDGFYRDIEAFATINDSDKEALLDNPAQIYLEISVIGTITRGKVTNDVDSSLKVRIEKALYKLHDFIPATMKGEPIESILTIDFKYQRSTYFADFHWKPKENKLLAEFGGFIGQYAGNINDRLSINGGIAISFGTVIKSTIYSLEASFVGAKDVGDFTLPQDVERKSNQALGLLGIAIGREYSLKDRSAIRAKINLQYGFVNVGFKNDESVYRLNGWSPGIEVGYYIPLKKRNKSMVGFSPSFLEHGILMFVGTQRLMLSGDEADGLWYGGGVKYLFSSFSGSRINH